VDGDVIWAKATVLIAIALARVSAGTNFQAVDMKYLHYQ